MEVFALPCLALVVTLSLLSLNWIIRALYNNTRRYLGSKLPPGSLGWPIIGETPAFLESLVEGKPEIFIRERMEKYKSSVFKTSFVGEPYIVMCGAAAHKLLFSNENKLVNVWWPNSVRKLFNSALLNLVGDDARRVRKLFLTFLSPDALKGYTHRMDFATQQHIKTHWEGKEKVKVYPTLGSYTFQLSCNLLASIKDAESIRKLSAEFHVFVRGTLTIPMAIPGTKFYRSTKAAKVIREELRRIIRQRKEVEGNAKPPEQDLVWHLLRNSDTEGKFLTETEIVDNILLLLFAGFGTSSSALTVVMKYLAEMPQVYARVLQEQMEIAKSKGDQVLKWEDVQKMRYTWSVVSEVMRLSPPGAGVFRQALHDFTYQGYLIPKGWKLYLSTVSVHKDAAVFENPEDFDESRFDGKVPTPYSFCPFGGGPRMCLGNEFARLQILMFLHHIVTRFKWDISIPDEKFGYDPLLTPCQGFQVLLRPHQ